LDSAFQRVLILKESRPGKKSVKSSDAWCMRNGIAAGVWWRPLTERRWTRPAVILSFGRGAGRIGRRNPPTRETRWETTDEYNFMEWIVQPSALSRWILLAVWNWHANLKIGGTLTFLWGGFNTRAGMNNWRIISMSHEYSYDRCARHGFFIVLQQRNLARGNPPAPRFIIIIII